MRRLNAILLLFIYLSTSTELHQLLRLPVLFTHFHEHQLHHQEIGFVNYITLHYFTDDLKERDHTSHNELPFKQDHCEALHIPIAILPEDLSKPFLPEYHLQAKSSYKLRLFPYGVLSAIWQPPKSFTS
jgi:hypothetical protein